MKTPVAGILLAAGSSTRMGRNKMLLPLGGESIVRGAARRALAGGLSPLIVVLGMDADRVAAELEGLACLTVVNQRHASGMMSSLYAGLTVVPATTNAAMILLADMPFVTAEMIANIARRYDNTHAPLVISDYDGVVAPPVLYVRRMFAELLTTTGREMVERHRHEAEVLRWPPTALVDLDVPEDYERVKTSASL